MFFSKTSFVRRGAALIICAPFALAMLSIFAADPSTSPTPADKGAQAAPQSNRDSNTPQLNGGENKIVATTQADAPVTAKITKTATPQPTPSQNVTINLIHRLVQRGVLTQEDADELIKQAENDAANARALAAREKVQPAAQGPDPSSFSAEPLPLTTSTVSEPPPAEAPPEIAAEEDTVHVHYVPEIVKQQLRDEIREEVLEEAREENWANPRTFPTWASRITPFADIRLRYDGRFYPSGNDNTGAFPNFNAINTGPPFDVTGTTFSPQLNVDQDRQRARIRLRFGAQMDLEDGFTFGLRIGTGETNTPTSTDQTLGVANGGQGGNFSKYAIWLDRAFVRYELGGKPGEDFVAELGRFDNPYFTVSELIWDVDLGWDGLALSGKHRVAEGVALFATAGIFPVFNTELNFSSNRPDKFPSEDKWLYGGQAGVSLRFNKDFSAKVAGAFYDFYNIEGKLSDPFVPLTSSDQGNTDDSRPAFAQKGNTYFPIRDIIPTADNGFGTTKQFQYFGLATPFRVANVTGSLDYAHFDPVHLTLFGEWLENVAFDYNDINAIAVNNRGPSRSPGKPGNFAGGNVGWIAGLKVGHAALEKRWDWALGFSYEYLESDATVDAFNDSDFGGGGTNVKGYTVSGALALSPHVSVALRWMSADQIGGPTFRNDILYFDFNAKF
ncbi:MAG: putative porin [Chthoniobacterales bacterium]